MPETLESPFPSQSAPAGERCNRVIYLDHNATTPPAPEALEAAVGCLRETWGNASGVHAVAQAARGSLETARIRLARLVNARTDEVVFTSGGTEAANQALLGLLLARPDRPGHLVVSAIEHPCVLQPAERLEASGWRVTRVLPDAAGRIVPEAVAAALRPDTRLVSVMLANNDTGVIQPVAAIARLARAAGALLHTDAVQAVGRIPLDFRALGVDYLSLSGHKFHGPKGAGALLVRAGLRPPPLLLGGAQERALRAGTENVPAIAGLGVAAELAGQRLAEDAARIRALRDRLQDALLALRPDGHVNGGAAERLPNTLSITFPGLDAAAAVIKLDRLGIAAATGSACSAATGRLPHTLLAMGLSEADARATLRLSLGRGNTAAEIAQAAAALAGVLGIEREDR